MAKIARTTPICPFCCGALHLHARVGDSSTPHTAYCELIELRKLRDGLLAYASDESIDLDSRAQSARRGDLIALARQLRASQKKLSEGIKSE